MVIHTRDTKGPEGTQSCSIQRMSIAGLNEACTPPSTGFPSPKPLSGVGVKSTVHNIHYARIARKYVVRVCRDDQLAHGKSHALRVIAGEDIAKVPIRPVGTTNWIWEFSGCGICLRTGK
jgi:hypothetical protein